MLSKLKYTKFKKVQENLLNANRRSCSSESSDYDNDVIIEPDQKTMSDIRLSDNVNKTLSRRYKKI